MGNRRTIVFLLVGVLLSGVLLWAAQRRARFFPAEGKVRATLLTEGLDGVETLTVERGDARVELRRSGDTWSLYAPFAARADQGLVTRLLDAFESAHVSDAISLQELRKRELSLKALGLSPALATVRFGGPRGQSVVRIGAPTPLGGEVYVRLDGLDQVFVVSGSCSAVLPHGPDDLRSRRLMQGSHSLVRGLEIRAPGRPFIKLSKEGGTWRLVQPTAGPASDARVDLLIDAIYRARIESFMWPAASGALDALDGDSAMKSRAELYGLGSDVAMQITLLDGGPVPSRILLGRPVEDSAGLRYALLHGGESIGTVSNDLASVFQLQPAELRDTRLFYESPGDVRRVEVRLGDVLFAFAQTNSVWRMQSPVEGRVDQCAVKDAVEGFLRLNASRVTEDVDDAQHPPAEAVPPASYIEMVGSRASYRVVISPDEQETSQYRITFTNSPVAYHVGATNVPLAFVSLAGALALHDRTIFKMSAEGLRRITVRRSEQGVTDVLRRDSGAGVWRLGEGMAGQVINDALSSWTSCIAKLSAERVEKIGVSAGDMEAYGLNSAWLEISIDVDADDALRKTLVVGRPAEAGKRYALVRGLDVLFVLGSDTLRTLESRLVQSL